MNKNEKFVITINRELGSGGRTVGRKLAEKLNVKYYDKALLEGLIEKFGVSADEIEKMKAQKKSWWSDSKVSTSSMMAAERNILEKLAEEGSCVFAGRSGFLVFRDWPNHLNVFIQSPIGMRVQRLMEKRGLSLEDAMDIIEEVDEGRETYIGKYSDRSRYDTRNYDLVISMANMTEDDAVEVIMEFINRQKK